MVCTRTLYNMVWANLLPVKVTELPEALKRSLRKRKNRENKKRYGTSISQRPEIASLRTEEGHWEGDTVVGKRDGQEAVVLSLLEKKTQHYIAIRISGKTSKAVLEAMKALHDEFGEHFADVLRRSRWTTAASLQTLLRWSNGVPKCFLLTRIPLGSGGKMNDTTVYFGLSSPKASP
jgi:hypothetical protein